SRRRRKGDTGDFSCFRLEDGKTVILLPIPHVHFAVVFWLSVMRRGHNAPPVRGERDEKDRSCNSSIKFAERATSASIPYSHDSTQISSGYAPAVGGHGDGGTGPNVGIG